MEEGTVAKWNKKVGDTVNEGDILAEIETDKATMEFESFHQGTLLHIGLNEGESAPVDSVLAIIGEKGTDISGVLAAQSQPAAVTEKPATEPTPAPVKPEVVEVKATPQAAPPPIKTSSNGRIASPLAKKLASEKGVDLSRLKELRSRKNYQKDIDNYQPQAGGGFKPLLRETEFTEIANSQMRKTIAKRLSASKFTAPHYYLV